jgi:GNAT superfamily N-acetyltransferase
VRPAGLADISTLRQLRLEALSEAPVAFGSTYERELGRSTADWQRWISPNMTFILYVAEKARGMAAGVRDETDPAVVHLMAMWVHPQIRGSGGADALAAAVIAWARSNAATCVRLKVIQGNDRARHCYVRLGFSPTGQTQVRERDGLIEMEMERSVV